MVISSKLKANKKERKRKAEVYDIHRPLMCSITYFIAAIHRNPGHGGRGNIWKYYFDINCIWIYDRSTDFDQMGEGLLVFVNHYIAIPQERHRLTIIPQVLPPKFSYCVSIYSPRKHFV
jgi:hypothetical protein